MIPLLVIGGPTASGKTGLSIELAKALDGEIISADSMQIYKGMDIGTAKPTMEERQGIPHHLIDIVNCTYDFSLSEYVERAHIAIRDIYNRGKLPIMTGGTGLYINTVTENLALSRSSQDERLREELLEYSNINGAEALHSRLSQIDPESGVRLHPNDTRRIIRALEVYTTTGLTQSEHFKLSRETVRPYKTCMLAINWDRNVLYDRIDQRVDIMMKSGLVGEVRRCIDMGATREHTSMQGIGYKEVMDYFELVSTLNDTIDKIKMQSRRYAKRQISWFLRNDIKWLLPRDDLVEKALEEINNKLWEENK